MSYKTIELTRKDLQRLKEDKPTLLVSVYDFKRASITTEEVHNADLIVFRDNGITSILKKR